MEIDLGNITWQGLGVGALIAAILREVFARLRDNSEYNLWQLSNFKDHSDLDYFEQSVRKCRENIIESKKFQQMVLPTDRNVYVLANGIQKLGAHSLLGAVPIESLFFLNGPQIVNDWILVRDHVLNIREDDGKDLNKIAYQRRHGEWLVLLTLMWFMSEKTYNLPSSYKELLEKMLSFYGGEKGVSKREKILFRVDSRFCSRKVKWQRRKIRLRYWLDGLQGYYWHKAPNE